MSGQSGRGLWGSKLGFVLAASGSAIGLGNIIFFGSNAYRFGGGAFYLPYFIALFFLGIPMMIVEFGLGKTQRRGLPGALRKTSGKSGEYFGWFAQINAVFIAMYYITILSWSASMMLKAFGPLYSEGKESVGPTFSGVLESYGPVWIAVGIWALNLLFLSKGTKTIELVAKAFVPLMWLFMIVLVIRGVTLPSGLQGIWYLFTPDFEGIMDFSVWQGAFSQMFFSLSLGLGTMCAYSSYLPKKADVVTNSSMVSLLNCSFEFVAGVAIFSILFAFTLHPGASTGTLGMSLVVIPSGIAEFPAARALFAFFFFFLLLIAGLTSSISIIQSPVAALQDKFGWSRVKTLGIVCAIGLPGSILFAWPEKLLRNGVEADTAGSTFLGHIDHWAFSYGLLFIGLVEAIFIGWVYGIDRLRRQINETAKFKLGPWFNGLIKYAIPAVLIVVIGFNIKGEVAGFYGTDNPYDNLKWLPYIALAFWMVTVFVGSALLTNNGQYPEETEEA